MSRYLITWRGIWASEITDDADRAAEMARRGAEVSMVDVVDADQLMAGGGIRAKAEDKDQP